MSVASVQAMSTLHSLGGNEGDDADLDGSDVAGMDFGSFYTAFDNETPKGIAAKLGLDSRTLTAINKERLSGLGANSKLMAGTVLILPYDGTADGQQLGEFLSSSNDNDSRPPSREKLIALYRTLKKIDTNKFFLHTVTDEEAPLYSKMIVKPMSLHNIRTRVDAGEYSSLTEFASDFVLMCKNAIVYNENDTDFHIEARRLLAEGMKEIERFHWSEITAGEGGANGGSKSTVPYVKYTHPSTDVGHISMNILSTNAFHRAVPRLGGKATDPPKKIPLVDIRPKDWNTVCPPTFLDYGPWQSFGVRYDSREASVDAGVHTSAIVDADEQDSLYTDYSAVAKMNFRRHAAKVLRTVARMNIPNSEIKLLTAVSMQDVPAEPECQRRQSDAVVEEEQHGIAAANHTSISTDGSRPDQEEANGSEQANSMASVRGAPDTSAEATHSAAVLAKQPADSGATGNTSFGVESGYAHENLLQPADFPGEHGKSRLLGSPPKANSTAATEHKAPSTSNADTEVDAGTGGEGASTPTSVDQASKNVLMSAAGDVRENTAHTDECPTDDANAKSEQGRGDHGHDGGNTEKDANTVEKDIDMDIKKNTGEGIETSIKEKIEKDNETDSENNTEGRINEVDEEVKALENDINEAVNSSEPQKDINELKIEKSEDSNQEVLKPASDEPSPIGSSQGQAEQYGGLDATPTADTAEASITELNAFDDDFDMEMEYDDMEVEATPPGLDEQSKAILENNADLLVLLERLQEQRMFSNDPSTPSEKERVYAQALRKQLVSVVASGVQPEHLVSVDAVRHAIGVEIVDPRVGTDGAPESFDDVGDGTKRKRNENDYDGIFYKNQLHKKYRILQGIPRRRVEDADGATVQSCANCHGSGLRWQRKTLPMSTHLCHACGLYQACNGRPRPAALSASTEL